MFWYSFESTGSEVLLPQDNAIRIFHLPLNFPCLASSIHNTLVVPAVVAVVVEVVAVREYSSGLHWWSSLPPPMGRSSCAPSAMVAANALHLT